MRNFIRLFILFLPIQLAVGASPQATPDTPRAVNAQGNYAWKTTETCQTPTVQITNYPPQTTQVPTPNYQPPVTTDNYPTGYQPTTPTTPTTPKVGIEPFVSLHNILNPNYTTTGHGTAVAPGYTPHSQQLATDPVTGSLFVVNEFATPVAVPVAPFAPYFFGYQQVQQGIPATAIPGYGPSSVASGQILQPNISQSVYPQLQTTQYQQQVPQGQVQYQQGQYQQPAQAVQPTYPQYPPYGQNQPIWPPVQGGLPLVPTQPAQPTQPTVPGVPPENPGPSAGDVQLQTSSTQAGGTRATSCINCHRPGRTEGGLDLTNVALLTKIQRDEVGKRVKSPDPKVRMPFRQPPLNPSQINDLAKEIGFDPNR